MNKIKIKRKHLIYVIKILLSFIILLLLYYMFVLRPALKLPSSLLSAKKTLTMQYANLLQNRIALKQIIRLDPASPRYIYARERAYTLLTETKDDGLRLANESELPELLPKEIKDQYPLVLAEYTKLLSSQPNFIDTQKEFDQKTDKIFEYYPERDIKTLDLNHQRSEIIERSESALKGLDKIKSDYPKLKTPIEKVQDNFKDIIKDPTSAKIDILIDDFYDLKRKTHEEKVRLLTSTQNIELLTDISNLIIKYRSLIKEIDIEKSKIKKLLY